MSDVHRISRATFDRFCAGAVDQETVALLRRAQYSRRRLLLAALVDAARDVEPAWQLLTTADEVAPDVVEDVLMAPSTGTWLVRALGSPRPTDVGYLNSVAAAVAVRAGLPCDLPVPVRVLPVHRHAGVEIDDRTPYRRFQGAEDLRPLTVAELAGWCSRIDDAWPLLGRYTEEVTAGVTTIVPIPRPTRLVGSSSKSAFGAVAMAFPDSAADLAAVLVHEFQHSKLNAMLDLVVLHTRPEDQLVYAPWRDDPRPLTGLLHGIYAFTSNVEFWYARGRVTGARADVSAFAKRHLQVRSAVESLADADDLTELGRELVDAADRRLTACPPDDVPGDLLAQLTAKAEHHRATWRG